VPRETATSGKKSGKPPIAAGIAAARTVEEGCDRASSNSKKSEKSREGPKHTIRFLPEVRK
jgi:hypothetical protein